MSTSGLGLVGVVLVVAGVIGVTTLLFGWLIMGSGLQPPVTPVTETKTSSASTDTSSADNETDKGTAGQSWPALRKGMTICNLAWSNTGGHKNTPFTNQDVVLLDGFDSTAAKVTEYRAKRAGLVLIGYLSVGTLENWRPDKSSWPSDTLDVTNPDWDKETWINLDNWEKLKPVMTKRLEMLKAKGFDSAEFDNASVDSPNGEKRRDANVAYLKWLADTCHSFGLRCFMKNGPDLCKRIAGEYDGLITESALEYKGDMKAYLEAFGNKCIFDFEYKDGVQVSEDARKLFSSMYLDTKGEGWKQLK